MNPQINRSGASSFPNEETVKNSVKKSFTAPLLFPDSIQHGSSELLERREWLTRIQADNLRLLTVLQDARATKNRVLQVMEDIAAVPIGPAAEHGTAGFNVGVCSSLGTPKTWEGSLGSLPDDQISTNQGEEGRNAASLRALRIENSALRASVRRLILRNAQLRKLCAGGEEAVEAVEEFSPSLGTTDDVDDNNNNNNHVSLRGSCSSSSKDWQMFLSRSDINTDGTLVRTAHREQGSEGMNDDNDDLLLLQSSLSEGEGEGGSSFDGWDTF
eukprot:gene13784-29308_t